MCWCREVKRLPGAAAEVLGEVGRQECRAAVGRHINRGAVDGCPDAASEVVNNPHLPRLTAERRGGLRG